MRLLVDTHVLVWTITRSETIPHRVATALLEAENVFASPVSAYEINYKRNQKGGFEGLPVDLSRVLDVQSFEWLPILNGHAIRAAELPLIHGDPWDRILIAQAQVEGLTLVTRDADIARYDVPVLW